MNSRILLGIFLIFFSADAQAQNVVRAQKVIDTLCSDYFAGRGYVNQGDVKAAEYIKDQFVNIGLLPLQSKSYFHNFQLNVNTFPSTINITQNGSELRPGHDYIVSPDAPSFTKNGLIVRLVTKEALLNKKSYKAICKLDWSKYVLV